VTSQMGAIRKDMLVLMQPGSRSSGGSTVSLAPASIAYFWILATKEGEKKSYPNVSCLVMFWGLPY
jgi:hypothetical protein